MPSARFLRFAAVCALLTVFTTLAIHLLPSLWAAADTFEEQLQLRRNPIYLARLWIVIVHCILVVIAMFAVGSLRVRERTTLIVLGFLGFFVFAVIELLRTSLAIFAVNRTWRENYVKAADDGSRETMRTAIEAFPGINSALFFLFVVAFLLGTLCYGVAFIGSHGADRVPGIIFLLWVALSLPGLAGTIAGADGLARFFQWVGPYFQPAARAVVGVWLWKRAAFYGRAVPGLGAAAEGIKTRFS